MLITLEGITYNLDLVRKIRPQLDGSGSGVYVYHLVYSDSKYDVLTSEQTTALDWWLGLNAVDATMMLRYEREQAR